MALSQFVNRCFSRRHDGIPRRLFDPQTCPRHSLLFHYHRFPQRTKQFWKFRTNYYNGNVTEQYILMYIYLLLFCRSFPRSCQMTIINFSRGRTIVFTICMPTKFDKNDVVIREIRVTFQFKKTNKSRGFGSRSLLFIIGVR